MPPQRNSFRWSMVTVEPLALFYTFGQYLSFPINRALMYKKACLMEFNETFCDEMNHKTFQDDHEVEQDRIQEVDSFWTMLNQVALAGVSTFIVFFFIASWGDRVDRKIPILLPILGGMAANVVNLISAHFMDLHIGVLLAGSVLNSLLGPFTTFLMGVYTYIVCVAAPDRKTLRVGIVEAVIYMSSGISVFVSGHLKNLLGFQGVYILSLCLQAVGLLYCIAILPSVRPNKDTNKETQPSGCSGALSDTFNFIKKKREKNISLYLWLYVILINLMMLGTAGEMDILYLFLRRSPRSFNSVQYGYFKGTESFTRSLALITILPLLKGGYFKWRDSSILMAGVIFKGAQFCLLGFSKTMTVAFIALIFAILQGFPAASIRATLSKLVDDSENGRLFGVVAVTEGLVSLAAAFLFNGLWSKTFDFFDGILFEGVAMLSVIALVITLFLRARQADMIDVSKPTEPKDCPEPKEPKEPNQPKEETADIKEVPKNYDSINNNTRF